MTTEEKLTHFLEASIERATRQSTQIIDDYKRFLEITFRNFFNAVFMYRIVLCGIMVCRIIYMREVAP